jgi:hypothetical protein
VSTLSVRTDRYYALHLLDYRAREISGLLTRIPLGISLQDEAAEALIARDAPAWELWDLLREIEERWPKKRCFGPVAAGKLLARKRPHLIPVYDSHVKRALSRLHTNTAWWNDLRCQLMNHPDFVPFLERVRARVPEAGHLSLLRNFDIMCWMFEKLGRPPLDE